MPHLFISYARIDTRPLAKSLHAALTALPGVTAWMDTSLQADASWAAQIQQQIDRADYVIVLLSKDVNRPERPGQRRSFVLNEIAYAIDGGIPILPVLVERARVPVQIAGTQYIDLTRTPGDPRPIVERVCQRFHITDGLTRPSKSMRRARSRRAVTTLAALAVMLSIVLLVLSGGAGETPITPTGEATVGASIAAVLRATRSEAINIRSAPYHTSVSNILSSADDGAQVRVLGRTDTGSAVVGSRVWFYIIMQAGTAPPVEGWVHSQFLPGLAFAREADALPTPDRR